MAQVAITLRESHNADFNHWSACFLDAKSGEFLVGPKFPVNIVDRVGGGDSFCAGLVYGLLNLDSHAEALSFAVSASALAHTVHGDFNLVSLKEVQTVAGGNTSGRVQR